MQNFLLVSEMHSYKITNILFFWHTDKRYETIIMPVDGMAIPFHVSTVKVRYLFNTHQ